MERSRFLQRATKSIFKEINDLELEFLFSGFKPKFCTKQQQQQTGFL